jgi:hypothetical protein
MDTWELRTDGIVGCMDEMYVTVDSRGRTTLGKGHAGQYRLTNIDGVLMLEPGSFVTEAQQQVWRNPELHQHLRTAASRPGGPRPTR